MTICRDCHAEFDGGPRTLRCPPCRAEQISRQKAAFAVTNPGYYARKMREFVAKGRAATHQRQTSTAWVLVEVPAGCDFRPGATFTSTELRREYCHDWIERGMVFENNGKTRRF